MVKKGFFTLGLIVVSAMNVSSRVFAAEFIVNQNDQPQDAKNLFDVLLQVSPDTHANNIPAVVLVVLTAVLAVSLSTLVLYLLHRHKMKVVKMKMDMHMPKRINNDDEK